jgi:hypothetical protein
MNTQILLSMSGYKRQSAPGFQTLLYHLQKGGKLVSVINGTMRYVTGKKSNASKKYDFDFAVCLRYGRTQGDDKIALIKF